MEKVRTEKSQRKPKAAANASEVDNAFSRFMDGLLPPIDPSALPLAPARLERLREDLRTDAKLRELLGPAKALADDRVHNRQLCKQIKSTAKLLLKASKSLADLDSLMSPNRPSDRWLWERLNPYPESAASQDIKQEIPSLLAKDAKYLESKARRLSQEGKWLAGNGGAPNKWAKAAVCEILKEGYSDEEIAVRLVIMGLENGPLNKVTRSVYACVNREDNSSFAKLGMLRKRREELEDDLRKRAQEWRETEGRRRLGDPD